MSQRSCFDGELMPITTNWLVMLSVLCLRVRGLPAVVIDSDDSTREQTIPFGNGTVLFFEAGEPIGAPLFI